MHLDPALCRQAQLARDARFDGRFFTGVRSTGIYCRPVCPARMPDARHCVYFPTAAAAQAAGFRPCLRCRPETAPGLGAWRGTSATVSRALTLIEDGALDGQTTAALAARLGVGERHLRRLFAQHAGASPLAFAQTRRVLLAKQLIHETSLPMAAIAHASGFGSIRRFNETFQTLFARPPAALRRHARPAGAPLTLSFGYRPPYDWPALLGFLAARAIPGVEAVSGGAYHRTIALGAAHGSLSVTDEPARHRLRATIRFANAAALPAAALPAIVARVRRMFDLCADPAVIAAALARDPRLAPLVAARPGLRVPGAWDAFELAVRAIAGQQITVTGATQLTGRIAREHGAAHPAEGGLTHVFPAPATLARAALGGMPTARAAAIAALARTVAADPTLFERGETLEAGVARLRALPGIGPWTAQYIALRALREPDAFPAADIGLQRALDDGSGRPTPAALLARAEAWRPWRAYAALHLWMAGAATVPEVRDALAA